MPRFWRRRPITDFSDEIQAHLDIETDRLIAEGLTPADARARALQSFGNVTAVRERFYEASRWTLFEQFVQDLRYACRGMRQSRAFVATTVLTLAVGLGLITVAFTVFNAYFLRPYAVQDPEGLHQIGWRSAADGGQRFRWRDYEELRGRPDLFDAVVAESTRFVSSNGRPLAAALVSDNYFDALRPRVALGRALASIDAGAEAAVISHDAWVRLFARNPAVVGHQLEVNGRPFTVVGVLAAGFSGLSDFPRDVWLPLTTYAAIAKPDLVGPKQPRAVEIVARLGTGVTAAQAESALGPVMTRILDMREPVRAHVRQQASPNPLSAEVLAVVSPVFAAFALVLITACANVSNVMLARAIARHREIAVRLSLGASRGRVVRQLLTEGLLIAVLAGLAGLALAVSALGAGTATLFDTLPPSVSAILRLAPMEIDRRVFLFALGVAAVATLLFALMPALHASSLTLTDALRGQGGSARRGSRMRSVLVIGQVAVSLVLVIVALTLARNGAAMGAIDLGYDTAGVISVNVRGQEDGLVRRLATMLESDSRVAEAAVTGGNPLFVRTRDVAAAPSELHRAIPTRYTFVAPAYFSILRIPIVRGRAFAVEEATSAARVAIVSAATANAFWSGADPIGQTIRIEPAAGRPVDDLPGYPHVTVIGVARDVVSGLLMDGRDKGHIYLPMNAGDAHATALLVRGRSAGDLSPVSLQRIFQRAAPDPEVFEALPLEEMRALQVYPLVAASWVGSFLGIIALLLSVSGLYGVLMYTLSQRTREIGIRMALGATAGAVVKLVVAQSARLAGVGVTAGLLVAFGAMKMLSAVIRLETVSVLDVIAFSGGLAVVVAATVAAAYHPARRATRLNPSEILRSDV